MGPKPNKMLLVTEAACRFFWANCPPRPPHESLAVGVRHDVADVTVLWRRIYVDSTCCSASSIIPAVKRPPGQRILLLYGDVMPREGSESVSRNCDRQQ